MTDRFLSGLSRAVLQDDLVVNVRESETVGFARRESEPQSPRAVCQVINSLLEALPNMHRQTKASESCLVRNTELCRLGV